MGIGKTLSRCVPPIRRLIDERQAADAARWAAVSKTEEAEEARWTAVRRAEDAEAGRYAAIRRADLAEQARWGLPEGASADASLTLARPAWLRPNFTEPRVLCATRDLCAPSATVFDVGANFGGITVAMSRTVGPRGAVCAFEANPAIAARCQAAVMESGCSNVQVYQSAIYKRSGERVPLYISENMVADSIHHHVSDRTIPVPTLALDDFVTKTALVPQFVKIDIEGAEIDALEGFEQTIASAKPLLILEQGRSDNRCLQFLKRHGYSALDLSTYTTLESVSELPEETLMTDILYAPAEKLEGTPYRPGVSEFVALGPSDFEILGLIVKSKHIRADSGRYIVQAQFGSAPADAQDMFGGIAQDNEPVLRHHGRSDSLSAFAHRWVFDVHEGEIAVVFEFASQYPPSFKISSVKIFQVDAFRGRARLFV